MRRVLVLGQETDMFHCPDWYPLMQAAKYLGVAPWQLLEQSVYWRDKALIALTAENQAAEYQAQQRKK